MSVWIDTVEWRDEAAATAEGWLSLIWLLRSGMWNDKDYWVDSEVWDL